MSKQVKFHFGRVKYGVARGDAVANSPRLSQKQRVRNNMTFPINRFSNMPTGLRSQPNKSDSLADQSLSRPKRPKGGISAGSNTRVEVFPQPGQQLQGKLVLVSRDLTFRSYIKQETDIDRFAYLVSVEKTGNMTCSHDLNLMLSASPT